MTLRAVLTIKKWVGFGGYRWVKVDLVIIRIRLPKVGLLRLTSVFRLNPPQVGLDPLSVGWWVGFHANPGSGCNTHTLLKHTTLIPCITSTTPIIRVHSSTIGLVLLLRSRHEYTTYCRTLIPTTVQSGTSTTVSKPNRIRIIILYTHL